MKKREIGQTGVEVSLIGIGAWQMGGGDSKDANSVGHGWGGVDDAESVRLIHRAEELGINLIDTADIYGNGHSERVIGTALKGRRSHWVIATKGGLVKTEGTHGQYFDGSARHIREACEASLKRLQTDRIDFYQLHRIPAVADQESTMAVLAALRKEGKIRFYGISTDQPMDIIHLQQYGPVDIVQLATDLFHNHHSALSYCHQQRIGTLIRSPLAWGATFGKYADGQPAFAADDMRSNDPAALAKLQEQHQKGLRYEFLWKNTGRKPVQAALRAVLDKPGITSVIPGTRCVSHLLDNAGAVDVAPLSQEEIARVWTLNQTSA